MYSTGRGGVSPCRLALLTGPPTTKLWQAPEWTTPRTSATSTACFDSCDLCGAYFAASLVPSPVGSSFACGSACSRLPPPPHHLRFGSQLLMLLLLIPLAVQVSSLSLSLASAPELGPPVSLTLYLIRGTARLFVAGLEPHLLPPAARHHLGRLRRGRYRHEPVGELAAHPAELNRRSPLQPS